MRRFGLLLASAATALLLASAVALAYPGDLDLSFSGDGKVVTDFAPPEDPRDDEALDVVIQPDGKIISAGYAQTMTDTAFALARYNEDGTLDASFGTEGKVTSDVAANWRDRVVALGLQSDGKIIAAGESYNPSQNTTTYVLARYNTNGSLDGTFAGDGFAEMAFGCCSAELNAVAIQTDDKIVVGGRSYAGEFLVARYDKDGTLDTTFDQDGVVRTDLTPNVDDWQTSVFSLALQADGKIVAAGPTNPGSYTDFGLARYNTDGSLDNSFDGDGKLISYITSKDDAALAVVIQDDGKVIAGGRAGSYSTGGLARYNPDGSFDTSFGTSGKVVASGIGVVWDIALEPDGKILAATDYSSKPLVRYKADGTYDTTFQATGSGEVGYYPSLALQSDGKPVLAGFTSRNGYNDFKLARYMGGSDDTPPQTTITSKPPRFNDETWAKFKFASSEQRSSFKCSIDDKPFRTCYERNGEEYYSLANGIHTFRVQATDGVGNTDPTPAKWTWNVDTKRPSGSVVINRDRASTTSRSVTLKLSASDPSPSSGVGHMRFKNNGGEWSRWFAYDTSKGWTLGSGAGNKTVYVQYKDRAGNISATASDSITYRP